MCAVACALHLYPAIPDWGLLGVCLVARFGFTPLILDGVCGVCVWAWVLVSPRHSWLGCLGACVYVGALLVPGQYWQGCAVLVCVVKLGLWLRLANLGLAIRVCVFVCARNL